MSNKVQVIFTFERVSHQRKEVQGGVEILDSVNVSVESQGLNGEGKTGPQHVYAFMLKRHSPEIIRFLTDEVKAHAKKFGFEMKSSSTEITEASDNIH
ncbi:hypothetical protein ZD86_02195 [Salmonella enterica subsp. enterica]|nr:hypothetical protein [Salmonella enterica subsp. enterica serovar Poona]EBW2889644.1 hypothetical protein [Salmonella enterica subsp. enterica serovar Poona]ECD3711263.1 hypothetical protein [Salmonella enterica subsp. enterica serovar Poona]ECG6029163.1 hypothetical protein [Salmonella enterica subsp. enterica serovar Poona]ECH9318888.1 hypothetical protein [Salmonella enterica subsp. enterica serovar Poona]